MIGAYNSYQHIPMQEQPDNCFGMPHVSLLSARDGPNWLG
ncbi:MAG: hypothetical protein GFH27_549431n47 [Chloroflexi bacterium AL-W]|nr:hypothetical protein [Chloroflexi bacterium AL-N1]NOK71651.1 hypothetical protein [Chloroflexi bacterium AL-N10]NOK78951.1 hypothetical protein [Chloroflexi bacterium AL-N5]NOK86426.1 hypothetical protein [Chloroflexi bacterium AL-W]